MSEEQILQAGVSALKLGDKARAKTLLAKLVKENPNSEQGWYFLGLSVSNRDQQDEMSTMHSIAPFSCPQLILLDNHHFR